MIPLLENCRLTTDLDADFKKLLNVGALDPMPPNLVDSNDPRLSDPREPIPGSVTDASVASDAAINQNKLNLNGSIPPVWLGTTSTTAAQGDLAEYLANKGQASGYASLDSSGKVPLAQVPSSVGTGTVTSVGLSLPADFSISGSPVTSSGTLSAAWASVAANSWFGNPSGSSAVPTFQATALPVSLIPNLDAAKITSGTFAAARIPVAVGVGVSHAPGAVPDPGASGNAADYLARDMTYKSVPAIGPTYQPVVPNPTFLSNGLGKIFATDTLSGASIFYSTTSSSAGFAPFPAIGYVTVTVGTTVWAYAAKAGYNNSSVVNITA